MFLDNGAELQSLLAEVKQQKSKTDSLGQVIKQQKSLIQQLIPQMLHLAHKGITMVVLACV